VANPVAFKEQNKVIGGHPDQGIVDLPAHVDYETGVITSVWQLSPDEIAEIVLTGRVYLQVVVRTSMPPVKVAGENPLRR
jgi:hypothetical protein